MNDYYAPTPYKYNGKWLATDNEGNIATGDTVDEATQKLQEMRNAKLN